jgi:hypothetical protein
LCNGVAGTSDGGVYDTFTFGPNDEVVLEYNKTSSLDFKLAAVNSSYRGAFAFSDSENRQYTMTIGSPIPITTSPDGGSTQVDAGTFTIDWPSMGATPAAATTISNANCGVADTDCVVDGDCTVTYDSSGNMTIGVTCGEPSPYIAVVFPKDTSMPSQFFVTNPNGQ